MARSNAAARRRLGGDERGQMMMLSAVVLLIGFLALTGMVSRVNQLGTQTGTEARQAVLDEAGPLKRSIDSGLARLSNRTFTNCCTWAATGAVTSNTAIFSAADVGLNIKGGSGAGALPRDARITSVASATSATVNVTGVTQSSATTIGVWRPGFSLKATTTPTAEAAAIAMLEQLQLVEARHGFWMDWQVDCATAGNTNTGRVVAALSDGIVWVEVRSSVNFPRADCSTVTG